MTLVSPTRDSDAKQWADGSSFTTGTGFTFLTHQASTTDSARGGGGTMYSGAGSIPGGATIDDATWTITPDDTFTDTFKCVAYAHDSSSPGAWADASQQDIWLRTTTTASTAVTATDVLGGASTLDIDVTAIIQELTDRGDWDAGSGKIVLLLLGNNETDAAADARTTRATATLAINYTPANDTATVTATVASGFTVQTPVVASPHATATATTVSSGFNVQTDHVHAYAGTSGLVATPRVQLATRAPSDRLNPPVDAPYLFDPDWGYKLKAFPAALHDIEFTGSFRFEFDLVLGEYDDSSDSVNLLTVLEPGVGTRRIVISIRQFGHVNVTLTDVGGTNYADTSDYVFANEEGNGQRIRLAVAWTSSTGATVIQTGETSSDDLDATSWTTVETLTINGLTVLNTDQCEWWISSGGVAYKHWKFIQMRAFDDAAGTNMVSDVVAADGAASKVVDRVGTLDWDYQSDTALYPYGDWEDINADVRYSSGISTKRGRSTDLGSMSAGTMSATLASLDRKYEPEYTASVFNGSIVPFTPIRFQALHDGIIHDLWQGFVRSWTPSYPTKDATVRIECVDGFRPLNLGETNDALTAAITDLVPVGFWPLTEASGTFADGSVNSNTLTLTGSATYQGAQVTVGDRRPVVDWDGTSDAANTSPGSELFLDGDFSFCASVSNSHTDGFAVTWIIFGVGTGSNVLQVRYRTGTGTYGSYIVVDRKTTAISTAPAYQQADMPPLLYDDKPHTIAGTFVASTGTLKYYIDGQLWFTEVGGSTTAPTFSTPTFMVADSTYSATNFKGGLGFLAVWDRVLTDYEATTLTAPRIDGHAAGTADIRVNDLLDIARWPDNKRSIETGSISLSAKDATNTKVLAEIQTAETADIGEFFIAPNGDATYRARAWRTTNKTLPEAVYGDNTTSELPYSTVSLDYNETRIVNDWAATPTDGDVATSVDLDSIKAYGRRKQSSTLDLPDGPAAQTWTDNRLAARKDPDTITRQLVVQTSKQPRNLFPVCLTSEISDRYTIVRRPPGGGDEIRGDHYVESIGIKCHGDNQWTFTYTLSPAG